MEKILYKSFKSRDINSNEENDKCPEVRGISRVQNISCEFLSASRLVCIKFYFLLPQLEIPRHG
jgi:hypothetical protein